MGGWEIGSKKPATINDVHCVGDLATKKRCVSFMSTHVIFAKNADHDVDIEAINSFDSSNK